MPNSLPAPTVLLSSSEQKETLVLQSHRQPLPHSWLVATLGSVEQWARANGYDYLFTNDALFAELSATERTLCARQPVVASDLARLRLCQRALSEGYQRVVWCDADTLIIEPEKLQLRPAGAAFGRELWLQPDKGTARPKLYKKIHNAFMQFEPNNPVLDFYTWSAARLISNHAINHANNHTNRRAPEHSATPMVAQLAGPKFLTHLHNVLQFDVLEEAQVVSPMLLTGLLEQDETVLRRYRSAWEAPPVALNLCASEVLRGSVLDSELAQLIDRLLDNGAAAFGAF